MHLGQILLLCCQLLLCSLLPSTPANAATTPVTSQSPGSSATTGPPRQVSGVRLAGGNQPSEGRLEVLIDGGWGTVCDEDFGVAEARVACTMLGYPGYTPKVKTSASYGEGSGSIAMDEVSCVGNETSLSQCQYRSQHNCSHSQDVGIQCSPLVAKIRLAGGSTEFEGRVEVQLPGMDEWGTVCDNGFDIKDARVVCRMLGELRYTIYPTMKTGAYYGQGNGSVLMDDLKCHGEEFNLGFCSFLGSAGTNCGHEKDVGVHCRPDVAGVRLRNSWKPSQGRLEVWMKLKWGPVCDEGFTNADADVVCRMLGYSGTGATAKSSSYYGRGTDDILLNNVDCKGTETHLEDCSYTTDNCTHDRVVAMDCATDVTGARLVNGNKTSEGRLEVNSNGQWGTVCDTDFDVNDAIVACRMLGYTGNTPVVKTKAFYGQGSGEIVMGNVGCTGTETSLGECAYVGSLHLGCRHSDDVGINCVTP